MLQVKAFEFNPLSTRSYVLYDPQSHLAALIDPAWYRPGEQDQLLDFLTKETLKVSAILLTHGHFDHVFGVAEAHTLWSDAPIYLSSADEGILKEKSPLCAMIGIKNPNTDFKYVDNLGMDAIFWNGVEIQIVRTPGHTPGSVCYHIPSEGLLFSGDTLFAGSIGRTDLQGGNYDDLMTNLLHKVMALPSETIVLPGHGPDTEIGRESTTNPFLLPIDEYLIPDEQLE